MVFDVAMELQYSAENLSREEMASKLLNAVKLLDGKELEMKNE